MILEPLPHRCIARTGFILMERIEVDGEVKGTKRDGRSNRKKQ